MATKKYLDLDGLSKFWIKAQAYIDNNIEQNKYDDTELVAEVAQNTAAISILNGTGEGSVKKAAADAVSSIIAGADAKYDTLKEISDFIINDITGSAGLVNKVTANSNAIESLETATSILVANGDGSKYLANDGSYKTVDYAVKADADGAGKNIANTYATKEEIPTKVSQLENDADYLPNTPQIENGVYVVDINGDLHDSNTFTGTADDVTGIGLVTDNGSWIVALDEWYSNSSSTAWNGNRYSAWGGYNKTVTGCFSNSNESQALLDFGGEANTDAIIAQLKGTTDGYSSYYTGAPAAEYCRAYSKGYKDAGFWYLPAAGELNEIVLNKDAINTILTKLGKNSLSNYTWSSSQYGSTRAWHCGWSNSYWYSSNKDAYMGVRPICKLEIPSITSRIESLETTTSILVANGDGSKYLANDGTYKPVATKVSQLENDADYLPNTPQIENGVYVVDINGDLHDSNTFTGTADDVTGIGLVTDKVKMIVALDGWCSADSESTAWNGNIRSAWGGYNKTVTGCFINSSSTQAVLDFNGEANTDAIITQLKGTTDSYSQYYTGAPAAEYCRAYSKGYKDVGSWYLPAAGELNEIVLNKDAIDAILTKLGKNSLSKNPYTWSSSQGSSSTAWVCRWSNPGWLDNLKYASGGGSEARPICKLEVPTITSRIESLEDSVSELSEINIKAAPTDTEIDDVVEYVTATEMEAALARIAELENYVNGLKENIAESIQLANRIIG